MDNNSLKKKIADFLGKHNLCVISSIHINKTEPESALVGYANTNELEIIFSTSNKTRKYANILANPNVSLVIGWDGRVGSIQYEGYAKELKDEEKIIYIELLASRNSEHKKHISLDSQRYFLIKPRWIRFMDNSGNPPGMHELKLS